MGIGPDAGVVVVWSGAGAVESGAANLGRAQGHRIVQGGI